MPLSDDQIVKFASKQGVQNPDELLMNLQKRNAQEFARRPQDLIELCADWKAQIRIRTHREQVEANVRIKLLPRGDRPELVELSFDKAIEGASRLALAMLVTRRMTIRHNAASDDMPDVAALNPSTILTDWTSDELKMLLERPLFGFASYGRVRFHHRSIVAYLAAERLGVLRKCGMPFRSLKRLLFADTKDKTIVRPSKRPVAGWCALTEDGIFEILRDHEPAVLFNEGDPGLLPPKQRTQALTAFVERYGSGGWRGLDVPQIQVHRFAFAELANEIQRLWNLGIENPEVRWILLLLIEQGMMKECRDIPHSVAFDPNSPDTERIIALDAMVALEDQRLQEIACAISEGDPTWPDKVSRMAVLRLFPCHLSVKQLCQALGWIKTSKSRTDDLSWQLTHLIKETDLKPVYLEALRDGLVELVSEGLRWSEDWPHIVNNRPELCRSLAAVCLKGLCYSHDNDWIYASVLASRIQKTTYGDDGPQKALKQRLLKLGAEENVRLFWVDDSFLQSLHIINDPRKRLAELIFHKGPVVLIPERDLEWVKRGLKDPDLDQKDRELLFEAAMYLRPASLSKQDHLLGLKPLVCNFPDFIKKIDERLKPREHDKMLKRMEEKEVDRKLKSDDKKAKTRGGWIIFWRKVANQPDNAFSSEQYKDTARNLWQAMSQLKEDNQASGWNRHFLEGHFSVEITNRLRTVLMRIWREDLPTLASERPKGQRNTYLTRWNLGLSAIYAEAEDTKWATKLSREEAKLAARYAPTQLYGLPQWMESLVTAHPNSVEETLGDELTWELQLDASLNDHPRLLPSIISSPPAVVKFFIPRLWEWLGKDKEQVEDSNQSPNEAKRLQQVIDVVLKHGESKDCHRLRNMACKCLKMSLPEPLFFVWLATVLRIEPEIGVEALENRVSKVTPAKRNQVVTMFAELFDNCSNSIDLTDPSFTPDLLLRLVRLAYHHIRVEHDAEYEGPFTPDTRDRAETARNRIVNALIETNGEAGLQAKLEMANDPLCAHFKDHVLASAEEHWAQEIDSEVFNEAQAIALDRTGEAPAKTTKMMFAIMRDRLSDLDELLLRDSSPREAWAGISQEKVMRREIARELSYSSKNLYKVDQEAVTADEKETDIRLRSVVSDQEAVIELKLADGRTARDLRDTIHGQLVKKYMAPENCRAGCLLITLRKNRRWKHPENGSSIGLTELKSLLMDEAKRVKNAMDGSVEIDVHILDLRPRLPKEKVSGPKDKAK